MPIDGFDKGVWLLFWAGIAFSPLPAESQKEPATYATEWPSGPSRASLPDWAKEGRIRFARWDGGPIELAKGLMSGWPGLIPPRPDYLYTYGNWYDLSTVPLLREADINVAWVTFSNGFSIPAERLQRDQLQVYIAECHRQGIRVVAYMSSTNIFWEEMYETVPESRNWIRIGDDGKPISYGGADYGKVGRVTRYRASLRLKEWRDYLKKRIDLALEVGVDGFVYDNIAKGYLTETLLELYEYTASRKRDILMMINANPDEMVYGRVLNALTSEFGAEAGVWAAKNVGPDRDRIAPPKSNPFWRKQDPSTLVRIDGDYLLTNIGLLRAQAALSGGYKPLGIEHPMREVGERFSTVMSGPRTQLMMAESMAFGTFTEHSLEGGLANGLRNRDPEVMAAWHDIGAFNRFLDANQEYYSGTRSLASLAFILDDRSEGLITFFNPLSSRNVVYDVIYEHDLTAEKLKPYAAVAVFTAETMRDRALQALESFQAGGGHIFSSGAVASRNEFGKQRPRPKLFDKGTYYQTVPSLDQLASELRACDRSRVRVMAPPGVLYNPVIQANGRVLVYLLNYTLKPARAIQLSVDGRFTTARVISPDRAPQTVRTLPADGVKTDLEVPTPAIASILVIEGGKLQHGAQ